LKGSEYAVAMAIGLFPDEVSEDAVLGGRLRLRQPRRGHRVGHDAILLAAACPAEPGDQVVDLGAGVGAAGLAVAVRVIGAHVTLVEIDPALVALAAANVQLNGLSGRARAVALDITGPAPAFAAAGLMPECAAAVIMNPPFNDTARQQLSPDDGRRLAHAAPRATLAAWVQAAARPLRQRGTLTLIWRADGLADVLAALTPAFGAIAVLPVHPKPGQDAIRILARATRSSRGPLRMLPGLVLHDDNGQATPQAEAILRGGLALSLGDA
jgi:tRNA1(Val) A37 N6-methylase TrmN6